MDKGGQPFRRVPGAASQASGVGSASYHRDVNHAERLKRDRLVMRLHLAGVPYRDIAERVGISKTMAAKIVRRDIAKDAGDRQAAFPAELALEVSLQRSEALLAASWSRAVNGDIRAIEQARRLVEGMSKLQGLMPSVAERVQRAKGEDYDDDDDGLDDDDIAMVVDLKTRQTWMRGLDPDDQMPGRSGT